MIEMQFDLIDIRGSSNPMRGMYGHSDWSKYKLVRVEPIIMENEQG